MLTEAEARTKKERKINKLTVFRQNFGWLAVRSGYGEESADLLAVHDLANGVILHAIANDNVASVLQGPHRGVDFRLHAPSTDVALGTELDFAQIGRNEVVDHPGIVLGWGFVVDAVDVGHQYGQIGVQLDRDTSGQAVVILDSKRASDVLVFLGRRTDSIVGVDDGNDVERHQLGHGGEKLGSRHLVVKVLLSH